MLSRVLFEVKMARPKNSLTTREIEKIFKCQ